MVNTWPSECVLKWIVDNLLGSSFHWWIHSRDTVSVVTKISAYVFQAPWHSRSLGRTKFCSSVFSDHHVLHPGEHVLTASKSSGNSSDEHKFRKLSPTWKRNYSLPPLMINTQIESYRGNYNSMNSRWPPERVLKTWMSITRMHCLRLIRDYKRVTWLGCQMRPDKGGWHSAIIFNRIFWMRFQVTAT